MVKEETDIAKLINASRLLEELVIKHLEYL